MTPPPSLASPKKPKSPRRQSSKQFKVIEHPKPHSSALPVSPTRQSRPLRQSNGGLPSRQMAGTGTFLAESPPMDHIHDNDDIEDPHDLSFSSNHILRASMVDNLVMSLDQFSGGVFDDGPYTPRSNSYDTSVRIRKRGHTFSSSTSSENDVQHIRPMQQMPQTIPRLPVRNSVRYQKDLQKLPSIFGEDEDSVRAKVYDAQRAAQPRHPRRKKNASGGGRSTNSSASSSIDLGHLASLSGRLGGPGNRRSRSFDFGARPRDLRTTKPPGGADGAPTPVIFPGPEAQNGTPGVPSGPTLVRKNSAKSSKSAYVKKGRAAALGSNSGRNDSVPQLPSMKSVPSFNTVEHRANIGSLHETIAAPRPGFFRRVFGSSRNSSVNTETAPAVNVLTKSQPGRATPVQDENAQNPTTPPGKMQKAVRRTSTDASANKENQPVITKKSSAFFRRRKKSVSNAVPPPLPLTLNSDLPTENEPVDGTSPVSSLRAFMDPYLVEPPSSGGHAHPRGHSRTSSMQGFYNSNPPPPGFNLSNQVVSRPRAGGHHRSESHGSSKTLKSNPKQVSALRIPHQDSFLADSSSAEEPMKRSPFDASHHSDNERLPIRYRGSVADLKLEHTPSATSLPSPLSDPRSATTRQGSWKSDRVSPVSPMTAAPTPTSQSADYGNKSISARRQNTLEVVPKGVKGSPFASTSDVSEYRSAPSTPLIIETPDGEIASPLSSNPPTAPPSDPEPGLQSNHKTKARQIFNNTDDEVDPSSAGAWLGDAGPEREYVRKAYMELFDWKDQNILDSLRGLCDRIILRGETQQMDRIMDAFAQRWCECNTSHSFRSSDVVHTICYSILLLNTDLHLADIDQKMTKVQFVRNTLPTIKRVAQGSEIEKTLRGPKRTTASSNDDTHSAAPDSKRPVDPPIHEDGHPELGEPAPEVAQGRAWELQIEGVLKSFYTSISQEPLPLFGAQAEPNTQLNQSNNFLTIGGTMLRRTPSVLSKAHSDTNRGRYASESKSLGARFITKTRSRPRLPSAPGFASSRTSIDEQSSAWSPSMSSTWSKASLGKTLTSMSVDSFGTEATHADYQSSIGFANALSQAIIREDQLELPIEDGAKALSLLEDESLELCGAPWAKEGIVKHKCHLEGVDKRSKDRNWNDCFAVIEKGYMRLFSFSMTAKSLRNRARAPKVPAVVGGGNWQDNAEELWKFTLRHTIASSLPPPGYSKARPYVWALSLPTGAVHLFSVGTPDIVKEFVSTANYWSARLSKEPMMGGISNMEYGWSDAVVNRSLTSPDLQSGHNAAMSPRPSTQMSMRSSMDHVGGVRPKLPGDKAHISEWMPPQQSMFASQLMEVDQLRALQTYVTNVEEELQRHNELRGLMLLAFTVKHPNATRAMNNWERKSSYLLREIVKFRTYIDTLQNAQMTKEKIYRMRKEEERIHRAAMDSRN
ncbi:Sec7 domain protein [Fonsecaea pedrosoi]|nr:Sec7 domain protein [Fonsecaea pedrosoi]